MQWFFEPTKSSLYLQLCIASVIIDYSEYYNDNGYKCCPIISCNWVWVILQSIVCIYRIYKHGFRYRFKLKLNDDNIIRLLKLTLPAIIGVSVYQLNLIVDGSLLRAG